MKRYDIKAKRKDRNEDWTEWTQANNYSDAIRHVVHVEELGFKAKVVPNKEVKALWDILGKDETEKTDAILDAGFRLTSEIASEIASTVRKIAKGVKFKNPTEKTAFLEMFEDAIKVKYMKGADNEQRETD